MNKIIALYDACVLYPAPLRDMLMHLALAGIFRAKWSADIHEEWIRSVLKSRPDLTRQQLERTRALMDAHVQDCIVEGYEPLIKELTLPDSNDRHVLAAAMIGNANVIVTFNLKDFPSNLLHPYAIKAQHPDLFIMGLIANAPDDVCAAIKKHRSSLKNPPKNVTEYLHIMKRQGLLQTVAWLQNHADHI